MHVGVILLACMFWVVADSAVQEKWFMQRLDHFNYEERRYWKQRYFVSDQYYRQGGPAFLQIGGEGPASSVWLTKGHWIEIAKDVGAMTYIVEHRFYGKSHPTNDTAVQNLGYLTSEQALADLSRFIENMTIEAGISEWITFGGSYPGSLSLWMRLKYPTLVAGAMSASAPLLAKLNFYEYNEVVNRSLTTFGSAECVQSIATAVGAVQEMLKTADGRKQLAKTFNLCHPLDVNDDEYFQSTAYDPIAETVQYNRDNRAFEGATGGNVTISTLCTHMTDKTIGNEVERYATIPSLFGKFYDRKRVFSRRYKFADNGEGECVDASYQSFIESMRRPIFDAGRTWTFQTCTEFGWYQTTDSKCQPFKGFPLELFLKMCVDIFGPEFSPASIADGITETNSHYGARKIAEVVSNAVLFNGGVDPWHAMSCVPQQGYSELGNSQKIRLLDQNPTFHMIFVPSSAHCAIMYPDGPDDPDELIAARKLASKYVKSWIK